MKGGGHITKGGCHEGGLGMSRGGWAKGECHEGGLGLPRWGVNHVNKKVWHTTERAIRDEEGGYVARLGVTKGGGACHEGGCHEGGWGMSYRGHDGGCHEGDRACHEGR